MPRFMLDTDTCSYIMKRSHPLVLKRLQTFSVDDVCMSVVTKAELLYGVELSPRRAHDAAALAAFLPYVEAVDLDEGAARQGLSHGPVALQLPGETTGVIGHRSERLLTLLVALEALRAAPGVLNPVDDPTRDTPKV